MPTLKSNLRDNHTRGTVADFIRTESQPETHLRVVSAYFTIHAYNALREHLDQLNGVDFIFGDPAFLSKIQKLDGVSATLREDNLQLSDQLLQGALARACADWITEKVTIRSVREGRLSHGKLFHFERGEVQRALMGSSNFTVPGLGVGSSSNLELNTIIDSDRDRQDLKAWFNELFTNEEATEDVTQAVLEILARYYQHNSPDFLYYKTLLHLFGDDLYLPEEDGFGEFSNQLTDTQVWAKLYDFQREAVKTLLRTIEDHNGAILADSVGLGKTFTALAVIKHYELRNARVLVLSPKKLRSNWTEFLASVNSKTNPFPDDRFNYTVLSHTDLGRERGVVGDVDLERLNWSAYDLIVIDESHAFRNDTAAPQASGRQTRYEWLMERVLQTGVKTKVLLLTATPVNNDLTDLRSQLRLITHGRDDTLTKAGIKNLGATIAKAQRAFSTWSRTSTRSTTALMESLGSDFFTLLDTLTLARSRKHIQEYYPQTYSQLGGFPTRSKPRNISPEVDEAGTFLSYEAINNQILELSLAIYHPTNYIKPEFYEQYGISATTGFDQRGREHSLVQMMKTNYLKRLESSVASFHATMQRTLHKYDALIDTLQRSTGGPLEAAAAEFEDEDDEAQAGILMGKKLHLNLDHVHVNQWLAALHTDRDHISNLVSVAAAVTPDRDAKLNTLIRLLQSKATTPTTTKEGTENRKALVFTAYTDTAKYLYEQIAPQAQELGLHVGLVTGDHNRTTLHHSNFESILTNFSPISKERSELDDFPQDAQIDILIGTDCISEGQNLQDCDLVVNYDIHWNPVRIIQRFGRIDRLGSRNQTVNLINFWPTDDLNAYLKLKQRVEGRMALVDLTATGSDNLLTPEDSEQLSQTSEDFRAQQLQRLREEIVDLEDLQDSISLQDFNLSDFRADLHNYMHDHREALLRAPTGLFAVAPAPVDHAVVKPGVIYCLEQVNADDTDGVVNPLHPYFLVYVREDGVVRYSFTHPKQVLSLFRAATRGHTQAITELCQMFDTRTNNGQDLHRENALLQAALKQIRQAYAQRTATALLSGRGSIIPQQKNQVTPETRFNLITWLLLEPTNSEDETSSETQS